MAVVDTGDIRSVGGVEGREASWALQVDPLKKPTFISKKRVFSEMKSKGRKGSLPSTPSTKTLKLKPATCLPSGEVGLCAGAAVMSTHVETAAVTRSDQNNEDRDAAVSPDDHTAFEVAAYPRYGCAAY